MEKTIDLSKMTEYNIYAGLGGGFGGAHYQFTGLYESEDAAKDEAYEIACEEYDSYGGHHGLRTVDEIMDEEDVNSPEEAEEIYIQEREDWIEYYVVLTSEDKEVSEDEIVRDYIIEEANESEG